MASAFKIAIVGSGPAGLSAAGRAAQLGLSHVLLEKTDHLSDTIYKYQKGKHVMATPSQLVLRSDMDFEAGKREKVLGTWDKQAEEHKVNVMLNAEVKKISEGRLHPGPHQWRGGQGRVRHPRHRHPGQSQQDALRGRRPAAHPVPARRSRRICRRAYHRDRLGRRRHRECARLAADPVQNNTVSIRTAAPNSRAKQANVDLLMEAQANGG